MKISNNYKNNKATMQFEISGGLLARNTSLNLIGQVVPFLIGVATIPFVIRGLGTDRFGLLSIAWVVLGYFTVFDLGLGRATTKFVSEVLGKGDQERVPRVVWTAVTAEALLGIAGAIVLVVITPLLVGRVLNVPRELIAEAKTTFYLLAISVPVVLTSSSFRAVLEAAQRFDLVNAVKIPTSCATYLLPLVGLALGFNLPGIVVLILLARVGGLAAYVTLNLRAMPRLKSYAGSLAFFPRLFAFGGWVMVTSVVSPILVYFERFLIGSLLSVAALAFYSAPYEMVTRLTIIPASLTMTLFPAFSTLEGVQNRQRLATIFARSIKYILLTLGPIVLVISLFAEDILQLWLGTDFAKESTAVLQLLAMGVLINSLAYTPFSLLQGVGRPDLPAKFHLLEMPVYIALAWILVSKLGIAGAAMAWTIRVTLDAILLFIAAFKSCGLPADLLSKNGLTTMGAALCMLTGTAYGLRALTDSLPLFVQSVIFIVPFVLFAWVVWKRVLDAIDRGAIIGVIKWLQSSDSAPRP
ncbi:MAG TPA: flippase [Desulfosporosinus sp.]|nr:flippase [Desulfosporosinus sp.]